MTMQQKNKLRVIELFGGIGAMTQALKRLGINFEIVDYVEIDKYAVASYNAMNGTNFEPQDITEWDKDVKCDLIMHGSPCQDFSISGLQKGGDEGSGTRSSLMWETVRIVNKLKPKYVVWENVRNVISETHWHNFEKYLNAMASMGYASAWQVLNAKDYGVPQNRERVFVVSVLNGRTVYEAMNLFGDSEKKLDFEFPEPFPLTKKLKDVLEDEVDEKYFLTDKMVEFFQQNSKDQEANGNGFRFEPSDGSGIAKTITTRAGGRMDDNFIEEREYLKIKVANKKGYDEAYEGDSVNMEYPSSTTRRGRVGGGIAQTLNTNCNQGVVVNVDRIRKLTPLECWRLMGQTDEMFYKAKAVNSDSQLYKQAGNSIVVDVLYYLMKNVFEQNE